MALKAGFNIKSESYITNTSEAHIDKNSLNYQNQCNENHSQYFIMFARVSKGHLHGRIATLSIF